MDIWKGYDRAGLDAQYNLRAAVPTFQGDFDRWRRLSATARQRPWARLDIPYGEGALENLDLFLADAPGAPVHVFIHGGYWQAMDKSDFDFIADGFAPRSAHTAIINYPLAPAANMDQMVAAMRAALAWLWRHAGEFDGDRGRIFVSGHSAGGHLTAMAMLTDWRQLGPDLPADLVKGGMAISGIFELEPIRLCYLNDKVGLDQTMARRNSPAAILAAGKHPRPLKGLDFCVGALETAEFHRQQAEFAKVWGAAGGASHIVPAPKLHHFNVIDELARPGSPLNLAVRRQMGIR
jgi:arylformamidase